jgi:hypothetical protein
MFVSIEMAVNLICPLYVRDQEGANAFGSFGTSVCSSGSTETRCWCSVGAVGSRSMHGGETACVP